jgi:hypothetical protein
MIASGALKIPPRIDALYVEQEVHADETPAFESVLMADKVRWALIKEERAILASTAVAPDEQKDARLAAIYEEVFLIFFFEFLFDCQEQTKSYQKFGFTPSHLMSMSLCVSCCVYHVVCIMLCVLFLHCAVICYRCRSS